MTQPYIFIKIQIGSFCMEANMPSFSEAELFLANMSTFQSDLDETKRAELEDKLQDAFDAANSAADLLSANNGGFHHSTESDGGKYNNRKDQNNE